MRLMTVIFLLVLLAPSARAQEIGRLFFTPQQRADLDARRKARVPDKPAAAAVASPVTRLDGYVKRSGAPSTVWINGESTTEGAPDAPRIDRGPSGSVSIGVGEAGGRIRMKPGESLDRGNGEVHDVLGDGEIRIRRRDRE